MEFIDQLYRKVYLPTTPQRIISLVPSQTELLIALGLRNNLVGITKFCVHPQNLKSEIPIVGGTKNVNFEKIKSLRPDIIICNKEENTKDMVKELEKIAPLWISDIETIDDSIQMIIQLGEIFNKNSKASEIASKIDFEVNKFREFLKSFNTKKVLYLIWKNPYMAAGKSTFIDSLLQENKYENIFSDASDRYPEVDPEDFLKADLILLSTEPYPFKKADVTAFTNEFKKEVKLVNGEFFSWYGSRLCSAFEYFKTLH